MLKIKIFTIAAVFLVVGIALNDSENFSSYAQNDEIADKVAKYKSWSRITKEPFKVSSYASSLMHV